ncbi:MAG TPA: ATP synthase subunit I [Blastocatellia bacterium]|nr:ATP synthase subunit I [Blastocatellia bacterium]
MTRAFDLTPGQSRDGADKICRFGKTERGDPEAVAREDDRLSTGRADDFTDPEAVERRVWRNIFAVIALAIVAAAIFADLRFMLGLAVGGALALLNYKWLHASLRDILAIGGDKAPPGTSMQFILRWVIIGAVVYAASLTGHVDEIAMLSGLLAPAVAVMIEAAYVTYKTLTRGGDR